MAAATPVPVALRIFYIALNVFSASAIVFANKLVFTTYKFHFVTTLTFIHTVFTFVGMTVLAKLNFFQIKSFNPIALAPLAFGYVGYIILNNLSLNLNTVGFYQILKIAIAPCVMLLDFFLFRKVPAPRIIMAVGVVCLGVTAATVTDNVAIRNIAGVIVGLASVVVTALYQIWAGSKQKELSANSSQLLQAYTPQALLLLAVMMPMLDSLGIKNPTPDSVLGFKYTMPAVAAIVTSAVLGVLVSLSTFLVIGATSSLTYNIVGHFKTIVILAGGCFIFGESMPWKRLMGIMFTMVGIAWYTYLSVQPVPQTSSEQKIRDKHDPEPREVTPLLKSSDSGSLGGLPMGKSAAV